MSRPWDGNVTLAQGAARAINGILLELCLRAQKGQGISYHYFDIGMFGYGLRPVQGGEGVESAFGGALSGRALVPIPEIRDNPIAVREVASADLGAPPARAPLWVEPMQGYRTPMCEAIAVAGQHVFEWAQGHQESFPPIVINITDGFVTDEPFDGASLKDWAQRLTTIATMDGTTLLFNIFLSPDPGSVMLPATDAGLPSPGPALFQISSQMPAPIVRNAQASGITPDPGARGFAFNADSNMLVRFLEIGTRVEMRDLRGRPIMQIQLVVFSTQKDGYSPDEWEDGAGGGAIGGVPGQDPPDARFAVADGATETYDSRRWANQLITSFLSPGHDGGGRPDLGRGTMSAWFKAMQERWQAQTPATDDYIDRLKLDQGTLATFVGGELTGLDGAAPAWQAAALGDVILFHVRNERLVTHFPPLSSKDFDSAPEGITTLPAYLGRMSDRLLFQHGRLAPGDMIFIATDAFAKWMITGVERGDGALWAVLGSLGHPATFAQLVSAERRTMALKDDDVTLMRIRLLARPASTLVVCL